MKDYNWDIGTNTMGGIVEGKQQIRQWIQRVLSTERNMYPQYSSNYGVEFHHLRGQQLDIVGVQMRESIRSALQQHPDILDIDQYHYERIPDQPHSILIRFRVITNYGDLLLQYQEEHL